MKLLLLILASLPSFAATINVVAEPIHTAIIVRFSSVNSPCLLEVSKSPTYLPVVYDVDSSLFTGANSDAANTSVVIRGSGRAWQVGKYGKNGVATALNGNNYSRALQPDTLHYFRVSCGGGTDVGTGTFTTRNIPLGNTFIPNQPVDGSTGAWLQPTLSYTDRSQVVIDPITGVALRRTMMGGDFVFDAGTYHAVTAGTGASWTTPNNLAATGVSYASYNGTAQARVVASLYTGIVTTQTLDFITIKMDAYGDGGTSAVRIGQICLVYKTTPTVCESDIKDLVFPTSVGTVYYNQSLAIGDFMGWTRQNTTDLAAGLIGLAIWKKATSGADTIFVNNVQVGWGQSAYADPTAGGFDDICGRVDANGWINCIIASTLYYINTVTGETRYGGIFLINNGTLKLTIPDWNDISVSNCWSTGDSSRAWDQTNPNLYYCKGLLSNHKPGIVRFTTDSTHASATQNTLFTYSNPVLLTPLGSDLNTIVAAKDPTVLPYFNCAVEARQGNHLTIGCWSNDQNSWCYLAVFDLGNGTPMNDASCGTITAGRCSNSGVGIIAVNKLYDLDIARGCTCHTIRSNGDTINFGWEIGGFDQTQAYGNYPPASALTANMDNTQTDVHVTSTWVAGAVSKSGTISSDTGDFGGAHGRVYGTGTSFCTDTTVGDTITASGQSRVVLYIQCPDYIEVDTAFSPNLSAAAWTSTWPTQPSGYATGEPVAPRFPRWVNGARVRDFFTIGTEMVRVVAKPSSSVWTVERGCNRDISLPYVPCTGTGAAHLSGAAVTLSPNSPQDVLNASSPATYWNFSADPTAADTNYADWSNSSHGVILAAYPYGFGGGHNTARGNANGAMISMTDYVSMASTASNGLSNFSILTQPPNYTFQEHQATFAGKYPAGGFGNDNQRHPSNQHYNWASGYFQNFFTDAPQFVNGAPVASSTQIEGSVYKVVVYNYQPMFGFGPNGLDRKYFPTLAISGKSPLQDISSTTSHIVNSSTAYTYCYAEVAGECRGAMDMGGASSAGDLYINAPGLTSTLCTGSETWNGVNDICVGNQLAFTSATVQYGVQAGSPSTIISGQNHARSRVLVKFGAGARGLAHYSNAKTIEGGMWVFSPASSNAYNQYLLAQAPPMANLDSIDRSNFGFVKLGINPPQGQSITNVIVKFGYDSTLQCTSRAEACVAAASNAPYFFESATYSGVSCSTSCSLDVPFFPANIGWYQIIYRDSGNATVTSGPVQLVVVP